jgi:hypothetical protein
MKKLLTGLLLVLVTFVFTASSFAQRGSITPNGLGELNTRDSQGNRGSITPNGLGGWNTR